MGRPSRYRHNYPSVTQIVDIIDKPGLRYWYGKYGTSACEQKKRESQSVGHGVHSSIEKFLRGASFDEAATGLSENQRIMLSYLTDWCSKKKPKVILMEESLYSHKFKFAGTPDLVCTLDRGKTLTLVDWKTDSVPRDKAEERERSVKYLWQVAGYALAYKETYDVWINKAYIVRASKDLQFGEVSFTKKEIKEGIKDFYKLRHIYERVKGK